VSVARKLRVDPELALRAASARFRGRIQAAEELAAAAGADWEALTADEKLTYYVQVRLNE
jgi:XTP/dITP diphosphohydrolase/tetrapyrrole methylase family protein/MazG family protein/ATP diphosphatase